jgi:hypothetical protein
LGTQTLQLARQCTAYALNCAITSQVLGGGACTGDALFSACCGGTNGLCEPTLPETVDSCIAEIDCANNGGVFSGGVCQTGTCVGGTNVGAACNADNASTVCTGLGGECAPFASSCHTRDLPDSAVDRNADSCPDPGPAGGENQCKAARKTFNCTIQSCP